MKDDKPKIHKTVSNSNLTMCGKIFPKNETSMNWEKVDCEGCLKFISTKGRLRIERLKKNAKDKV